MLAADPATAGIFVCTNADCSAWSPVTATQLNTVPRHLAGRMCREDVTVFQALKNAGDPRIAHAAYSRAGWRLYLNSSLWHAGATGELSCRTRLTGYLSKPRERPAVCQIVALYDTERRVWITICESRSPQP